MKKIGKVIALLMLSLGLGTAFGGCNGGAYTPITIWTYYSGAIATEFTQYVNTFNDTVGHKKRIIVEVKNWGGVKELSEALTESLLDDAIAVPDMVMAYADMAISADNIKSLADFSAYFSEKELNAYVQGYLDEGYGVDGKLKIFPIAKATEMMILNLTDWQTFADSYNAAHEQAQHVGLSDFDTWEGLIAQADKYYDWSDGKALFAHDSTDNFMLVGSAALGKEVYTVGKDGAVATVFDKTVSKKLWDSFYKPYVKGRYSRKASFGTDCIKSGETLAAVGSTSSAAYLPDRLQDDREITLKIMRVPVFENGNKVFTQQGAGMCMFAANKNLEKAGATFLKWFTDTAQNAAFCVKTGYLPVKKTAAAYDTIKQYFPDGMRESVKEMFLVAADTIAQSDKMYTAQPFLGSNCVRNLFKYDFFSLCKADAEAIAAAADADREQLLAQKLNDDTFESWYAKTKTELDVLATEAC